MEIIICRENEISAMANCYYRLPFPANIAISFRMSIHSICIFPRRCVVFGKPFFIAVNHFLNSLHGWNYYYILITLAAEIITKWTDRVIGNRLIIDDMTGWSDNAWKFASHLATSRYGAEFWASRETTLIQE